VKKRREGE
jgi:hypothetical protein